VELLQGLSRDPDLSVRAPAWWWLARAAFEAGDDAEALRAAEEHELVSGRVWRSWGLPELLLVKARAHQRRGEPEKARAALDRLLSWWRRSDANQPRLAEARALRAQLGEARAAAGAEK